MNNTPVSVIVELAPALKRFADPQQSDMQSLNSLLQQNLTDLVADLRIPVDIALEVRLTENADGHLANFFRVVVGGNKCRPPFPIKVTPDVNVEEFARSVTTTICHNRESLVTNSLSQELWKAWSSELGEILGSDFSRQAFHEVLLALVHRGFRIDRIKDVARPNTEKPQNEMDSANIFEEAICKPDVTQVRTFLTKAQYDLFQASDENQEPQKLADQQSIEELFAMMQDGLFYELGVMLPKVKIDFDEGLQANEFRFQLNDLRLPVIAGLGPEQFLVNDTPDRLSLLNVTGAKAINPGNGSECAVIDKTAVEICEKAGYTTWSSAAFILLALAASIRKNAGNFLNMAIVKFTLNQLKAAFPALVDTALKHLNVATLTQLLRDLLDEEISIRNLRGILETLLAANDLNQSKNSGSFSVTLSLLRVGCKRQILNKFQRGNNTLVVFLLASDLEKRIKDIDKQPLNIEQHDELLKPFIDEFGNWLTTVNDPIIVTKIEIRKSLRKLLEKDLPHVVVVCYQELSADLNIQPMGRLSLHNESTHKQYCFDFDVQEPTLLVEATAARYLEFMIHGFYSGLVTLQKLEGINDAEMETVYALGYNFFTYGKYEAAKDIFASLTAYSPYTAHYWRALGAVNQQTKDYVEAVAAYDMAIANDEHDIVSYTYRGESKLLSGNTQGGLRDFEEVLKIMRESPDPGYKPWERRCKLLLSRQQQS